MNHLLHTDTTKHILRIRRYIYVTVKQPNEENNGYRSFSNEQIHWVRIITKTLTKNEREDRR